MVRRNDKLTSILCILFTLSFVGTLLNYLKNYNRESQQNTGTIMVPNTFLQVRKRIIIDKSRKLDQEDKQLSRLSARETTEQERLVGTTGNEVSPGKLARHPTPPRISFIGRNQDKPMDNLPADENNRGSINTNGSSIPGSKDTGNVRSRLATNTTESVKISDTFMKNWCRLQTARVQWQAYLSTCENNTVWEKNYHDALRDPTDPRNSFIASWEISPAGAFSRFFIQSMTTANRTKSTGGDAWRIHLRGPSSLAPTVFDLGNGKYEVLFLLLESGMYRAEIFLDYTLCDGLKDPPIDWFKKGNSQGKNQPEGILLGNKPYLIAPFRDGERVEFFVPSTRNAHSLSGLETTLKHSSCLNTCNSMIWEGLGRWAAEQWKPYVQAAAKPKRRDPRKNEGTLWIFGDSVSNGFHESLTTGPYQRLCSHVFTSCQKGYHWVYDMKGYWGDGVTSPREPVPDGKDYDHERVLNDIRKVLYHPKMDGKSVLVLNMGIHYAAAVNFTNYKKLIDNVISISQNGEIDPENGQRKMFQGRLIWKTTTALNRHRFPSPHKDVRRFLTFPRVELYNAYATSAMCRAGIDVIDVYPISNSFPKGTIQLDDPVHYSGHVFRDVERQLFEMFRPLQQETD